MSEQPERSEGAPSGCPSPVRVVKTDSSSSRQSGSPDHWDAEPVSDSRNCSGRVRPSSWDDSDDDSSPQPELPDSGSKVLSPGSKPVKGSITSELNELKEQFFQSLEKENSGNDSARIQTLREKLELKCDRRQSPARVRRRSRSSSSSSPVPETKSSPERKEKAAEEFEDASPKTSDLDSRYYLNNFFSELRSKRISMLDSAPVAEKIEREDELMCDSMKLEMLNDLHTLEMNEDGGYFCKTSRKLSQILEVEENRKELEKSSEEELVKVEPMATEVGRAEESEQSPLQTARSQKSEKVAESSRESRQRRREGYKSLSFEEFGNFLGTAKVSCGSLSERSARLFGQKIDEDFIHLCAKSGKTRLSSPQRVENSTVEKPFGFLCLTEKLATAPELPAEPSPKRKEIGKSSNESLKIDLTKATVSGSQTPERSTVRSEQSHTSRTKSGRSRGGSNPQSPKFLLNIGDSGRSQRAEEGNTPEQQSKERDSRAIVESRMSSEDGSGRRSNRSSYRSEGSCESKTERKLHLALNSPSVESVKSSRSVSDRGVATSTVRSGRSSRRSEKKWDALVTSAKEENAAIEKEESGPPVSSSRTLRKASSASNRSGSSTKSLKSPKACEEGFSCGADAVTPRSEKIPALELSLQMTERPESQKASCRSATTGELNNDPKTPNHMPSEGNFSARSRRSGRSRRSTARSVKRPVTARPNSDSPVRSKESVEEGEPRAATFEEVYEALMKEEPVSSGRRGGSWREIEVGSQQASSRSENLEKTPENSGTRKTFTPKLNDALEERLLSSRRSSGRSLESCGKTASSFGNVSPSKSERMKSRPSSCTSEERRFTDIPPDVEKLDIDAISGRTTNRSFISEEDEKDENPSSRRSRSGTESDLHSNKRLSIINETSLEDFQVSNITESEEKDTWEGPRPPSRRDSKRISRSTRSDRTTSGSPKAPAESFRSDTSDGPPPGKESAPDGGTWSDLIETFQGGSNPPLLSEKNFPGFPPPEDSLLRKPKEAFVSDNSESLSLKLSLSLADGKMETPTTDLSQIVGMGKDQQREEDLSFSLVYGEAFAEKAKLEEDSSVPQKLYFVEVDKGGRFGMGEFGDMTCWSAGKSDHQDLGKPQDHGDGMEAFKSSEVVVKPEKREKETKTLRQLWTELKEDFRDSRFLSNERLPGSESDADLTPIIPIGLKTSKSDNCISRKVHEGSECQSSATYEFLGECRWERGGGRVRRGSRERGVSPGWKSGLGRYSSGSVSSPKEEFGGSEFDYERTPRLSRSMSDVQSQLQGEKYKSGEVKGDGSSSRAGVLGKFGGEEKEKTNLELFLAGEKEETAEKPNNWLSLKSEERKKSSRREKRGKTKLTKSSSSSAEPLVQYLSSRKSRSSVPSLKLRNSNCFQNFYKRFISVFCVTSNSSAATSK